MLSAGCCFFFGGLSHKVQTFNSVSNQVSNSLLFLAVIALILPSAAAYFPKTFTDSEMLHFSRVIAIMLLIIYICYLYFQLVSHNDLFVAEGEGGEEEEPEEAALTITAEVLSLLVISLIVAAASECDSSWNLCDIRSSRAPAGQGQSVRACHKRGVCFRVGFQCHAEVFHTQPEHRVML